MAYLPYGCNIFEAPYEHGRFNVFQQVLWEKSEWKIFLIFRHFLFLCRSKSRIWFSSTNGFFRTVVTSTTDLNWSRSQNIQIWFERFHGFCRCAFIRGTRNLRENHWPRHCCRMQTRLQRGRSWIRRETFCEKIQFTQRIRHDNGEVNPIEGRYFAVGSTKANISGRGETHRDTADREAIIFDEPALKSSPFAPQTLTFNTKRCGGRLMWRRLSVAVAAIT